MFLVTGGFGVGALLVLFVFIFMVGVGELGHSVVSPAQKSAASAPTQPGPAPNPAPNTASPAVPSTTGQAPAPADPNTKKAPTQGQQQK
jgi:hypothetical protein